MPYLGAVLQLAQWWKVRIMPPAIYFNLVWVCICTYMHKCKSGNQIMYINVFYQPKMLSNHNYPLSITCIMKDGHIRDWHNSRIFTHVRLHPANLTVVWEVSLCTRIQQIFVPLHHLPHYVGRSVCSVTSFPYVQFAEVESVCLWHVRLHAQATFTSSLKVKVCMLCIS